MASIIDLSRAFRTALLKRERAAATELVRSYGVAWNRIKSDLDSLLAKIALAREAGEFSSPAWLMQSHRLANLLKQVETQIARFSQKAEGVIVGQQAKAVDQALRDSASLMEAALGEVPVGFSVSFAQLPADTFEHLVGSLSNGSPLSDLLNQLGPVASRRVREELIAGLAAGASIQNIARAIRFAVGENLNRALLISRTEVLRSYRQAAQANYLANRDVLSGWVWMCALGSRTCAACWAHHGSFHTLDETLSDHPNGRCTMLPQTKTWSQMGLVGMRETRTPIESGETVFARLSQKEQRAILGNAAHRAYKDGAVSLGDFVGTRNDPIWGRSTYRRSLQEILGADASRYQKPKPKLSQQSRRAA